MPEQATVAICIVTYNSARFIGRCLEWVLNQDYPRIEVIVIDNASADETTHILRDFEDRVRVTYNRINTGFAAAQNQAIGRSDSDWVLTLNPDVRLTSSFVTTLLTAAEKSLEIGSACGKLLAMSEDFEIPAQPIFDSTGIYFTLNLRHFDRGSRRADNGQYDRLEYVFGATGAAALYRREMIREVSISGEFFDSDFFAYREDADVAWRAQLLGWRCLYVPNAIAYHVRSVLPSNRRSLPAVINMHSVKNRFLMRIKNMTPDLYRRHWMAITLRDLVVVGACLTYEFSSLKAFPLLFRYWNRTWAKRHTITQRRRLNDESIAAWFSYDAISFPAPLVEGAASPLEERGPRCTTEK